MSSRLRRSLALAALIAPLAVSAFASGASAESEHDHDAAATVYTQTNAAAGNAVLAFQDVNGTLTSLGSFPTGGLGAGTGLGSQGAVAADHHHLFAVNAGSNDLSIFRIGEDGTLTLTDTEPTGGVRPISVTVDHDNVYVVNATSRTVSGFRVKDDRLVPTPGSIKTLPGNGAAQISFDREGRRLVVTEKATNTLDVLPVRKGVAGDAVSTPSTGQTPFGFAIDRRNHVVVSNATGGAPGASSLTSYGFSGPAALSPISATVATTQTAACWVALSEDNRFAFTTNAGSGSISSYTLGRDGSLTLAQAVAASPGAGPIDMEVTGDELFTLAGGAHLITSHHIDGSGALSPIGAVTVPAGVVGLAIG